MHVNSSLLIGDLGKIPFAGEIPPKGDPLASDFEAFFQNLSSKESAEVTTLLSEMPVSEALKEEMILRAIARCMENDTPDILAKILPFHPTAVKCGFDPKKQLPAYTNRIVDGEGKTLLHHAFLKRDATLVRALLALGGNIKMRDFQGRRPDQLLEEGEWESFAKECGTSSSKEELEEKVDLNFIANFLGDSFIQDSGLEGLSFKKSLSLFNILLADFEDEPLLNTLKQKLLQAEALQFQLEVLHDQGKSNPHLREDLEHFAASLLHWMKTRQEGEAVLLPMGWGGELDRHGMLLEIVYEKEGVCSLVIYNSGGGLSYHDFKPTPLKWTYLPTLKFTGIPREKLEDVKWLRQLFEIKVISTVDSCPVRFDASDLYEGVLFPFKDYREHPSPPIEELEWITGQRSGTCSTHCIFAFLRWYLKNALYKETKFRMDLKVLEASLSIRNKQKKSKELLVFSSGQNRGLTGSFSEMAHAPERGNNAAATDDPLLIRFLQQAVERLCRNSIKLFEQGTISFDLVSASHALANKIISFCGEKNDAALSKHLPISSKGSFKTLSDLPLWKMEKFRIKMIDCFDFEKTPLQAIEASPVKYPTMAFSVKEITSERLLEELKELKQYCLSVKEFEKVTRYDYNFAHYYLKAALLTLPLPKREDEGIWKLMPAEETLDLLLELVKHFIIFSILKPDGGAFIALHKALSAAHCLACRLDKKQAVPGEVPLDRFPLGTSILHYVKQSVHAPFYQAGLHSDLEALIDYFTYCGERDAPKLFDYVNWNGEHSVCLPIPDEAADSISTRQWMERIENKEWEPSDQAYEALTDEMKRSITMEEYRKASLWSGVIKGAPSYFHKLRDFTLMIHAFFTCTSLWDSNSIYYLPSEGLVQFFPCEKTQAVYLSMTKGCEKNEDELTQIYMKLDKFTKIDRANNSFFKKNHPSIGRGDSCLPVKFQKENDYLTRDHPLFHLYRQIGHNPTLAVRRAKRCLATSSLERISDSELQQFCQLVLFSNNRLQKEGKISRQLLAVIDKRIEELRQVLAGKEISPETVKSSLIPIEEIRRLLAKKKTVPEDKGSEKKLLYTLAFFYLLKARVLAVAKPASTLDAKSEIAAIRARFRVLLKEIDPVPEGVKISFWKQYIALFSYLPPESDEEWISFFRGMVKVLKCREAQEATDPSIDEQMIQAHVTTFPLIRQLLETRRGSALLTEALRHFIGPKLDPQMVWEGEFPEMQGRSGDECYRVNLVTWQILCNGQPQHTFEDIWLLSEYREAFGSKRFCSGTVTPRENGVQLYETVDETEGQVRFLRGKEKGLLIEKRIEKERHLFISKACFKEYKLHRFLPLRGIAADYRCWMNLEADKKRLFFEPKKGHLPTFRVDATGAVEIEGKRYRQIDREKYPEQFPKPLLSFGRSSEIIALQKISASTDPYVRILYQGYLTEEGEPFVLERICGKWVWKGNMEHQLDDDQSLCGFKDFSQYLIVCNSEGKRKALMPSVPENSGKLKSGDLPKEYRVMSYDLDSENRLKPYTPLQFIYAAHMSLLNGRYLEARSYLEKSYCLELYSPEEFRVLGWLLCSTRINRDHSPDAIAIRAYAGWLGLDNLARFGCDCETSSEQQCTIDDFSCKPDDWRNFWNGSVSAFEETVFKRTALQYMEYLSLQNAVNSRLTISLSPFEEVYFLKGLCEHTLYSNLVHRLSQLLDSKSTLSHPFSSTWTTKLPEANLSFVHIDKKQVKSQSTAEAMDKLRSLFPIIRPGKAFREVFFDLLFIAKKGTAKEKAELLASLQAMRFDPDKGTQALRALLEAVVTDHPLAKEIKKKIKWMFGSDWNKLSPLLNRYLAATKKNSSSSHHAAVVAEWQRLKEMSLPLTPLPLRDTEEARLSLSLNTENIPTWVSIQELANKSAEGDEAILADLRRHGGKSHPVTFETLIKAFLQQKASAYRSLNPHLSHEEIERLNNWFGAFLYQGKKGKLCNIPPHYPAAAFPEFMALEYDKGFRLRRKQVEDLYAMLGITDEIRPGQFDFRDLFFQAMMGDGKTTTYGPLISILKADGYHLSLYVPPAALYSTNAADLCLRLDKMAGKKTRTFRFTRSSAHLNESYLQYIYETMVRAIKEKEVLVLPPATLQSLQNSYLSLRHQIFELSQTTWVPSSHALERKAQLLKQCLKLLKERGICTFDEVDLVLNVRKEVNYPLGAPLFTPSLETKCIAALYVFLQKDEKMREWNLHLGSNRQAHLTASEQNQVLKRLTDHVMHLIFSPDSWASMLFASSLDRDELYLYLSDKQSPLPRSIQALQESGEQVKMQAAEILILLRLQLLEWLPRSLDASGGVNYGFVDKQRTCPFSIPFVGNRSPCKNSEFSDYWEVVNRTFQLYLWKGLKEEQTLEFVDLFNRRTHKEWCETNFQRDIGEMPTAKQFFALTGFKLSGFNRRDKEMLKIVAKKLQEPTEEAVSQLLQFVSDQVLDKVNSFGSMIQNNAYNIASMPLVRQGYSGTMENEDTLPVQPKVNAEIGKSILAEICARHRRVHAINEGSVATFLEETLKGHPEARRFKALIDLGPSFIDIDSRQVAKEILLFMKEWGIKGVLYWEDATHQLCCMMQGEKNSIKQLPNTATKTILAMTGLKQEELFVYFPHHKLTGAHIILPEDALALATFGNTPLRDVQQGYMRMRGLFHKQSVEAVVYRNLLSKIAQITGKKIEDVPKIEELLAFAKANEEAEKEQNLMRSTPDRIRNEPRDALLTQMYQTADTDEERKIFAQGIPLFVKKRSNSLYKQHAGTPIEQSAEKFLEGLIVNVSGVPLPKENAEKLQSLKEKLLEKLPPTITSGTTMEWGKEVAVEQEVDQKALQEHKREIEVEKEVAPEKHSIMRAAEFCPWHKFFEWKIASFPEMEQNKPALWNFVDFMQKSSPWHLFADCFPENLFVTSNFLQTGHEQWNVFSPLQKPICEILVRYSPQISLPGNPWSILLLASGDVVQLQESMSVSPEDFKNMLLLEIDGSLIQKGPLDPSVMEKKAQSYLRKALVPVQFLQASIKELILPNNFPRVCKWAQDNLPKKRFLLENLLLVQRDDERAEYAGSCLEAFLNKECKADKMPLLEEIMAELLSRLTWTDHVQKQREKFEKIIPTLSMEQIATLVKDFSQINKNNLDYSNKRISIHCLNLAVERAFLLVKEGHPVPLSLGAQLRPWSNVELWENFRKIIDFFMDAKRFDEAVNLVTACFDPKANCPYSDYLKNECIYYVDLLNRLIREGANEELLKSMEEVILKEPISWHLTDYESACQKLYEACAAFEKPLVPRLLRRHLLKIRYDKFFWHSTSKAYFRHFADVVLKPDPIVPDLAREGEEHLALLVKMVEKEKHILKKMLKSERQVFVDLAQQIIHSRPMDQSESTMIAKVNSEENLL